MIDRPVTLEWIPNYHDPETTVPVASGTGSVDFVCQHLYFRHYQVVSDHGAVSEPFIVACG